MGFDVALPEGWTAPRELTGALPRKTRMASGGVTLVVGAAVFLLLGSACLFVVFGMAAQEMARTAELRRGSREATGVVTELRLGRGAVEVSYTFTADGTAFMGKCYVPAAHRAGLLVAGAIPIRFLSSNPAMNHPAEWEGPDAGRWVPGGVVGTFIALIGVPLIIQLRRDRQLVAEGVAAAGLIVKCSPRAKGGWDAKYQFRRQDGRVARGSSYSDRLEVGSTVCVLYLPQNPRRNKIYSGLSYRVAQ